MLDTASSLSRVQRFSAPWEVAAEPRVACVSVAALPAEASGNRHLRLIVWMSRLRVDGVAHFRGDEEKISG